MKLYFKHEREIKTFLDKQKLRDASRPALQEMLIRLLKEGKECTLETGLYMKEGRSLETN